MSTHLNRRRFLQRTLLAAAGGAAVAGFEGFSILRAASPSKKLNCALIGCGGRGMNHLSSILNENVVAVVDPDEKRQAVALKALRDKGRDPGGLRAFVDYRRLFDELGKSLDAVFIATPNHQHAPPALIAMQSGINVYCEKPLTRDVAEARRLAAMARRYKVAAQMGNQGHCEEGYRRLCEYLEAGVIGQVTETHSWTDRANGGEGPRPAYEVPPASLHWDEWLGPAPYRNFHSDLHPHEWHGWRDFGNGSIGNMGCHVLDGVYWGLKLDHPTAIELEEIRGGSDERYPLGSRVRWDFPAREGLAPVKAYWYEGLRKDAQGKAEGSLHAARGESLNLPPLMVELKKQYDAEEEFEKDTTNGTLYVGEKGVIYTGCYGGRMHIVPWEKMKATAAPPKTLPRPKNVMVDFLDACREGKTETAAAFEYGARLTEFTLLANLAQFAGVGRKVEWDGPNMRVTNIPELNAWLKRDYRRGWDVA